MKYYYNWVFSVTSEVMWTVKNVEYYFIIKSDSY